MAPSGQDQPNVLLVLCDQLRRSALGHAGDPNVETPHLDALAADGVRFTNACSTNPVCVPARFTLVTGEYAHTRLVENGRRLSPAERTIADAFGEAGYRTGYVGKWHLYGSMALGMQESNRTPIPDGYRGGFDDWRGFEFRNDPYDTAYFVDDDPEPRPIETHQTDGLTDIAVDYVEGVDEPFFAVVSYEAPHPPFVPPPEYVDRWRDRTLDLPPDVEAALDGPPPDGHGGYETWGSPEHATDLDDRPWYHRDVLLDDMRGYYGMIEHLDANVGRLLDRLGATGLREDTVVVFLSDHGEMLGAHGYRGKGIPYERSVGVPLLVSGPGLPSGETVDTPACSEDWFPTLLGLAGIAPDGELPGADLAPVCRGGEGPDRPGVPLEFGVDPDDEHGPQTKWRGFRTRRYKYTVLDGEPWQLFDLEEDPLETANRIDDPAHEEVAGRLHGHLVDHLRSSVDVYELEPAFGYGTGGRTDSA